MYSCVQTGLAGTAQRLEGSWAGQTELRVKPTSPVSELQAWCAGAVGVLEVDGSSLRNAVGSP